MTRKLTLLLLTFSSCMFANSSKTATFYFNQRLEPTKEFTNYYQWYLNGTKLENHKDTFQLKTNYPNLDTVILLSDKGEKRIIITRFYDKHIYELRTIGCCTDIDIFDVERLKEYDKTWQDIQNDKLKKDDYGIMRTLYEKNEIGKVKFKLLNSTTKDSIGGTFGFIDISYTTGILMKNNSIVNSREPLTTGESGYCFKIKIGNVASKNRDSIDWETSNIHFYYDEGKEYIFLKELASFEFRFFNRETLLVTFDNRTKQVKLELND